MMWAKQCGTCGHAMVAELHCLALLKMPSLWKPFVFSFVPGEKQGAQKNQRTWPQSQCASSCDEPNCIGTVCPLPGVSQLHWDAINCMGMNSDSLTQCIRFATSPIALG